MVKQCSLLILAVLIFTNSATAKKLDSEVYESLKCIKMFPYFERKHKIPLDTLHSISLKESGKKHSKHNIRVVWPWTACVEGQGHYFNTKKEAVLFVKKQITAGKENIDIGCMQVNLKHHPDAFQTLEHAFDPQINIAYGAQFLRSKYDQSGNWGTAIAHYHSATPGLGSNYKHDVIKIIGNMPEYKNSFKNYAYDKSYNQNLNKILETENMHNKPQLKAFKDLNKLALASDRNSKNQNRYRSNLMIPVYHP